MNYWQVTFEELERDSFVPVRKPIHFGSWAYECPICSAPVGILRRDDGMIYKRDQCVNGHSVDWSGADMEVR